MKSSIFLNSALSTILSAGETYPIAVDITEAPVIKDSDLNMKDPCYGVVSSSKYQTNAADFIRYIFNMKTA